MNRRTFTILELLVVLLLLGTLAALSVVQYLDSQKLAKVQIFETNVKEITKMLNTYKSNSILYNGQVGAYPTVLTDPQFKALFKQEPINPYTGKSMLSNNSIESGIQYESDGTSYRLCVVQQDVEDANGNDNVNEPISMLFTYIPHSATNNAANFTRASIARMPNDTTVVATNMPRFVNNDGVLIEDAVVNKIVSEGKWKDDWRNWNHWGDRTYWQNEEQYYDPTITATVFKGTAANTAKLYDCYPYKLDTETTKYTLSMYLKASATITKTASAYLIAYDTNNSTEVLVNTNIRDITLTPSWQKISWLFTATYQFTASEVEAIEAMQTATDFDLVRSLIPYNRDVHNIGIAIEIPDVNGIVFYAAKPQFEEQDYASTWTGPEGVRKREDIKTTLYDKIDMNKPWTIETWALPNPVKIITKPSKFNVSNRAALWQIGNFYTPEQLSITLWKYAARELYLTYFDNRILHSMSIRLPSDYTTNIPIYTAVTYDGNGNYRMYLGATSLQMRGPYNFVNEYPASDVLWIGSYDWHKGAWAGTILDMRISNVARTEQEINAAWRNKWPIPIDEHTTYKLTFDGTLESPIGEKTSCIVGY